MRGKNESVGNGCFGIIYFNLIRDSLVVVTCNGDDGHFIEVHNLNNKNE